MSTRRLTSTGVVGHPKLEVRGAPYQIGFHGLKQHVVVEQAVGLAQHGISRHPQSRDVLKQVHRIIALA
jgi:hypothetical protein